MLDAVLNWPNWLFDRAAARREKYCRDAVAGNLRPWRSMLVLIIMLGAAPPPPRAPAGVAP